MLGLRVPGSFDCVALRFANGNFAQDDNQVFALEGRMALYGAEDFGYSDPAPSMATLQAAGRV